MGLARVHAYVEQSVDTGFSHGAKSFRRSQNGVDLFLHAAFYCRSGRGCCINERCQKDCGNSP